MPEHENEPHHDGDFSSDFSRIINRRNVLIGAGALSLAGAALYAQGAGVRPPPTTPSPEILGTAENGETCVAQPRETNGPFPADGTNMREGQTVNALTLAGMIRPDITNSIAGLTGTALGVPMDLTMNLVNVDSGCSPIVGMAVYIWHCDAAGKYSLYEIEDQNYLRGMQIADASGAVKFNSILPGTYRGRWPHVHFEVFRSAQAAVAGETALLVGQLAFEEALVSGYYATDARYSDSIPNLAVQTLSRDNVFGDSTALQLDAQTVKTTSQIGGRIGFTSEIGLTGI
ncbi:intradiol ring-cleavage dioxygenase [Yoonia maritima]|uniref:dioxygenase family protein n=1 Tax=Yoonia maritima TaxID=1435347 RepID=UPI000D0FB09F|nr:intradiol ring-cleavage dioxygenase [Yoonia maritima]